MQSIGWSFSPSYIFDTSAITPLRAKYSTEFSLTMPQSGSCPAMA